MSKLKNTGLFLGVTIFIVMHILFTAAAITTVVFLLGVLLASFGWLEVSSIPINFWVVLSLIWMLMSGVESQSKQVSDIYKDIKSIFKK